MHWQCYLRSGIVYVPTTAVTKHRLYRIIEPVEVIPGADTDALHDALAETIARGNPEVPALAPSDYPPPILPKYAGVKSWNAFVRNASLWAFEQSESGLRILPYRRVERGAFIPDKASAITLPTGSTTNDLIDRMIAILQQTARGEAQ